MTDPARDFQLVWPTIDPKSDATDSGFAPLRAIGRAGEATSGNSRKYDATILAKRRFNDLLSDHGARISRLERLLDVPGRVEQLFPSEPVSLRDASAPDFEAFNRMLQQVHCTLRSEHFRDVRYVDPSIVSYASNAIFEFLLNLLANTAQGQNIRVEAMETFLVDLMNGFRHKLLSAGEVSLAQLGRIVVEEKRVRFEPDEDLLADLAGTSE